MNSAIVKNYVAISPDGSIIVKFNPGTDSTDPYILIKKVDTDDKMVDTDDKKITNIFDKNVLNVLNVLEWSLAVSDINGNYFFVAISYIIGEDVPPTTPSKSDKKPDKPVLIKAYFRKINDIFGPFIFFLLIILFIIPFICILPFVLYSLLYDRLFPPYNKRMFNNEVFEQFQLFLKPKKSENKGMIKIFRFDLSHLNSEKKDSESVSLSGITYPFNGVVGFLPSKNSTILVCMNYIRMQKFRINNKNKVSFEMIEKDSFLLPENLFNLFKELESSKDVERNWKYLLKSRYREFLMTDKGYNQQMQHIEIYNINTSQLVNVFYINREKTNEPEISIISNDSDLIGLNNEPGIFAISTDSDLFAYSYGDNNIITIYLMESGLEVVSKKFDCVLKIKFLEFIDENKKLFFIGEDTNGDMKFHIWLLTGCLDDLFIIEHNTSILSNYDYSLTKANGMVVFLDDKIKINILHNLIDNDSVKSMKSSSENLSNENFKTFKDLYLEIDDKSNPDLDDDETTVMNIACGLLVYSYNNRNDRKKIIDSKHVNEIIKFIKTFIKNHPDHWKLMEIQYPLMALLICARSISLIKFILFDKDSKAKNLHRPRSQYGSYPYHHESLKLSKLDNDLKLALSFCKDAVMLAYLLEYYSENSLSHIGWMINVTEILPELSKHKYEMKYNFPNKRFKTVSFKQDLLEVYLPLTQLIPTNFVSLLTYSKYRKLRYDMLSDICMVPLPNFTTCPNEETDEEPEETGEFEKFWAVLKIFAKFLRKIFIPINPFRQNEQFSPTIFGITNLTLMFFVFDDEWIILLTSVTTLILWIEMLLWLRLFSGIAINIYIFGSILKIIIPFFAFMIVLTVGFGHSMFILFGYPSLVNLHPSVSTYTLNNGSENFTLTETEPDNPFDTPVDAILSAYYWNTLNFGNYDYWPLKLLAFLANIILVLVLLNMIIALMNDAFNKAKEDGRHGLSIFRSELIYDYEKLYSADSHKPLQTSKYICFRRDSNLMKEWLSKSEEIRKNKLYSWFNE
ncbi:16510_t:CDS:2, partial [Rhizophagus irregularis]